MSLWWAKKEQLDEYQVDLIEELPLQANHVVLGPPGSGKTNVLLRRAQFVRTQNMPNVMVLTFTRALTEFVRTGCYDGQGREIFPKSCVTTLESWTRQLYKQHGVELPAGDVPFVERKKILARGALGFSAQKRMPRYDALFIDECQDLTLEEVKLLLTWSDVVFCVGDAKQQIYEHSDGLAAVNSLVSDLSTHTLPFHYRLVPEICAVADRIQIAGVSSLSETSHYSGPTPGRVEVSGPHTREEQLKQTAARLVDQLRAYSDMIAQGDRLGVVVARREDRDAVHAFFERHETLHGKTQVIRARTGDGDDGGFDPAFDPNCPISILTLKGCKGLEFRALHWLFSEELQHHHDAKLYYTVVTRAKTSLDILFASNLPQTLARACPPKPGGGLWG